jgi:hypothetical protein
MQCFDESVAQYLDRAGSREPVALSVNAVRHPGTCVQFRRNPHTGPSLGKRRHQFAVVDVWRTIMIYPAARLIIHETGLCPTLWPSTIVGNLGIWQSQPILSKALSIS